MGAHNFTVYSVIKRSAILYRDRTALICGNQRITYQEYLTRVDKVADGLRADGLKKGDRIAVLALNSAEFLYLYGAAAKIGAIVLPIQLAVEIGRNSIHPISRLARVIFVIMIFRL